jgi:hypothetical protein
VSVGCRFHRRFALGLQGVSVSSWSAEARKGYAGVVASGEVEDIPRAEVEG